MKKSDLTKIVRKMPRLRHSIPGQDFDPQKSEVLTWLSTQPEIAQDFAERLFDRLRHSGDLTFDANTRTWAGADTAEGGGQ
jgi:hypothetical protein